METEAANLDLKQSAIHLRGRDFFLEELCGAMWRKYLEGRLSAYKFLGDVIDNPDKLPEDSELDLPAKKLVELKRPLTVHELVVLVLRNPLPPVDGQGKEPPPTARWVMDNLNDRLVKLVFHHQDQLNDTREIVASTAGQLEVIATNRAQRRAAAKRKG